MKKRLKEMEEEAAALRDMQAKVEKEMSAVQGMYDRNPNVQITAWNCRHKLCNCCWIRRTRGQD